MTAFGSLYTASSGLQAFGQGMAVIGNNISNVSTTGYKRSAIHFADVMNDSVVTGSGTGQVGKGVQIESVLTDFRTGSLETTTESLDVALGGNGFFVVSPENSDEQFYTRNGVFRFDEKGYLKDPNGYVVQGYAVSSQDDPSPVTAAGESTATQGAIDFSNITDIKLLQDTENNAFVSAPERTSQVDMAVNLDSQSDNRSVDPDPDGNPAFAMFENWNGTSETPLASSSYSYESAMTIYDQNGDRHQMDVYFDKVSSTSSSTEQNGMKAWEYMVTIDPSEDGRALVQGDPTAGVLMIGTLVFNASGELVNQSAFTLSDTADPAYVPDPAGTDSTTGLANLHNWTAASVSSSGYFVCSPEFTGVAPGEADYLEMNFGVSDADPQPADPDLTAYDIGGGDPTVTDGSRNDPTGALQRMTMLSDPQRRADAATSYDAGSATLYQNQNGYSNGYLQTFAVDGDGVLTGYYSNGQIQDLYVLGVADCKNPFDLNREGGNLFAETPGCGGMQFGLAGNGNERFGVGDTGLDGIESIASASLEQSNVDMATEFVDMILTQKGFQANSKVVTTSNEILQMVNQMKK